MNRFILLITLGLVISFPLAYTKDNEQEKMVNKYSSHCSLIVTSQWQAIVHFDLLFIIIQLLLNFDF